ncbi:hypothetical protein NQ317_007842 [Molorchus minor]|uniref:Uncharacterized protein n=1 Tax=Molorchus minor TaxID=1323400 RepID=A0ABQ9K4H4_9CUCU|nr:hypothetical protein NQ317_007842 [Molorchus minor]
MPSNPFVHYTGIEPNHRIRSTKILFVIDWLSTTGMEATMKQGWLTWIQNSATNPTLALLSRWHELKRVERERQKTCSILFPMGDDHVREIAM